MPFISEKDRPVVNKEIDDLRNKIMKASGRNYKRVAKLLAYSIYKLLVDIYGDEAVGWYEQGDVDKILDAVRKCFDEFVAIPYEKKKREQHGKIIHHIPDIDQKGVTQHVK